MTAYLIVYGVDPTDRFAAYSYPSRAEAWKASTDRAIVPQVNANGGGGCAYVIQTEEDVTFGGSRLTEVYRALTGGGPQKFENRATGIKRLMDALPQWAGSASKIEDEEPKQQKEENVVSEQQKKRGRASKFGSEQVITVLSSENPKRAGTKSHEKFALYRTGMTVEKFLAAGGTTADLAWDAEHGFIRVEDRVLEAA